jgi:Fe-S cluster assembly protein SufD
MVVHPIEQYEAAFGRLLKEAPLAKAAPAWMDGARTKAFAAFAAAGFPTTRNEEWKYTDVAPLAKVPFSPVFAYRKNGLGAGELEPYLFGADDGILLVFVDGHYAPSLARAGALPRGVEARSIADVVRTGGSDVGLLEEHLGKHVKSENNSFADLNAAFLQDGAFVSVEKGVRLDRPLHVVHLATGKDSGRVTHPRTLAIFGAETTATMVESFISFASADRPAFVNAVSEIVVAEGAAIDHYKLQKHEENAYHIGSAQVVHTGPGRFTTHTIIIGPRFVRNTLGAFLGAEGIECTLNGLYLVTGGQHVDNHTAIDHAMPNCRSHELYKGILDGRARAVFNGKIFVRKDAQKTDAKQSNRNLILSDEALVDTKPQLEIFADDVKCTHGATVGQLDEEALFYLRSRGIPALVARNLLTYGFARDIIERIRPAGIVKALDRVLFERLGRGSLPADIAAAAPAVAG